MDIINNEAWQTSLLDAVARDALGAATCGVSVGGGRSRIHLVNDNPPEQQRASDVFNNFGTLQLSLSAEKFIESDPDPVIACRDRLIAADSALAYLVVLDDEVLLRDRGDVVDGQFSLALTGLSAGRFLVFVYRISGNYASGSVRFNVDDA